MVRRLLARVAKLFRRGAPEPESEPPHSAPPDEIFAPFARDDEDKEQAVALVRLAAFAGAVVGDADDGELGRRLRALQGFARFGARHAKLDQEEWLVAVLDGRAYATEGDPAGRAKLLVGLEILLGEWRVVDEDGEERRRVVVEACGPITEQLRALVSPGQWGEIEGLRMLLVSWEPWMTIYSAVSIGEMLGAGDEPDRCMPLATMDERHEQRLGPSAGWPVPPVSPVGRA